MGGKKAKCGACRNYFMFPSAEKLESSSAPLLTPEPIAELGPFLDEVLLDPPPVPRKAKFPKFKIPSLKLPSFNKPRWQQQSTGSTKPLFRPMALHENAVGYYRYLGGYLPRFVLLFLIALGVFYLLSLPSDPRSPHFFFSAAILGGVIAIFGFLDDFEGFANVLSVGATILSWAIAMSIAVIPCMMLFFMFIASQSSGMRLSPYECGMSFIIITVLFFLAIAFTGAFMQYGFFRPAAVFFIGFCLIATQAQKFYQEPFGIYTKLYSKNPEEVCEENPQAIAAGNSKIFAEIKKESDPEIVDRAVDDLFSANLSAQQQALIELSKIEPIFEKRELVCRAIISTMYHKPENEFWHKKIVDVLNAWMTPKVSDKLTELVNESVAQKEYWRVNLLAQVPNAPLASIIVNHWQSDPIPLTDAVYSLGERAEEPLWKYLDSDDRNVLAKTCVVLVQVGTKRSVPKLVALIDNPDKFVARIAKSSIEDIERKYP